MLKENFNDFFAENTQLNEKLVEKTKAFEKQ
jgi:hypothetical protein